MRILAFVPEYAYFDRCYWDWNKKKKKIALVRRSDSLVVHKDIEPVIEEIISHETLHAVIESLEGDIASLSLDQVSMWDGNKIIIDRNEFGTDEY